MVKIVTNPPHFSRFDVTTEKMISGPVEAMMEGLDKLPPCNLSHSHPRNRPHHLPSCHRVNNPGQYSLNLYPFPGFHVIKIPGNFAGMISTAFKIPCDHDVMRTS